MLARALTPWLLILSLSCPAGASGKPAPKEGAGAETEEGPFRASTFAGLALRGIGPALTSGRVGDIAVHPSSPARYFVASDSGGLWRTHNSGTTWTPVFDHQGSYSIGCVTIDGA